MAQTKPFYPGYYPGDPMSREPGGGKFPLPPEYDFDILQREIDDLDFALTGAPKWVKERIEGDIKFHLRASVYPTKASPSEIEAYGEEETQDLPGAFGIDVSLDPSKWKKGAGEQLKKTLLSWGESIWDYSDLNARQRGELWKDLLLNDKEKRTRAPFSDIAAEAIHAKTTAQATGLPTPAKTNPLKVSGILFDSKGQDLGFAFGKAIVAFQQNAESNYYRDSNHDEVIKTGLAAIAEELKQNTGLTKDLLAAPSNQLNPNQAWVRGFLSQVELTTGIAYTDKLATKVEEALAKISLEKVTAAGTNPRADLAKAMSALQEQIDKQTNFLSTLQTSGMSTEKLGSLQKILKPYKETLTELKEIIGDPTQHISDVESLLLINRIHSVRAPSLIKAGLKKGDVFRSSLERKLLRNLELVVTQDENVAALGGEVTRIARILLPTQELDRARNMYNEVIRNLEDEKLLGTYLWTARFTHRINAWTPARFMGIFMERIHYLGLVIREEDHIFATPKGFMAPIYKAANAIIKASPLGAFDNKLKFGIRIGDQVQKATILGGSHFEAVESLGKWLSSKEADYQLDANQIFQLVIGIRQTPNFANLTTTEKLKLIQDAGKRFGKKFTIKAEDAEKILKFSEWLATESPINIADAQALEAFILALIRYGANPNTVVAITKRYAGLLQKVTHTLNMLQTKILNTVLGKVVGTLLNLKNVIAEWLSTALTTAFSAITGSAGSFLATPLKFALRWVLVKIMDFGTSVWKLAIHADFTQIDKFIESSLKAVMNIAKYIAAVPVIILGVSILFFTVIFGSINPTNPAKGQGGELIDITDSTIPSGEQPPAVLGSCPINPADRIRGCASYPECHGTDSYWAGIGNCTYTIPWLANTNSGCGGCPNNCPGAACAPFDAASSCASIFNRTPQQTYYGYAFDVKSTGDMNVYLPQMGNVEEWTITNTVSINGGNWGYGVFLEASDGEHNYKLALFHVNQTMWPATKVGDAIGTLYTGPGFGPHVHIELMIDGIVAKPENHLCL